MLLSRQPHQAGANSAVGSRRASRSRAWSAVLSFPKAPNDRPARCRRAAAPASAGRSPSSAADGKPFSSARLAGKPYAIYFGFTRCGDVCPTTLGRLVRLRGEAGGDGALNIVFVTIDPANDGPKEVGQYAGLFNSPIIGLTGSAAQIDQVKKQYGIFAQPVAASDGGEGDGAFGERACCSTATGRSSRRSIRRSRIRARSPS